MNTSNQETERSARPLPVKMKKIPRPGVEPTFDDRLPHASHRFQIEMNAVKGGQFLGQHLTNLEQVPDIGP